MFAREWKARCPEEEKDRFIEYLYQTGVKDTSSTSGFKGAQIFTRSLNERVEITLLTYWDSLESVKLFAGENISKAKLYPDDLKYELEPDNHVRHYEVIENKWI